MSSADSARWVRARGPRIWNVRFAILWIFLFFLLMSMPSGPDAVRTVGAALLGIGCAVWTFRVGVRADGDGLTVVGLFRTSNIPSESVRSVQVVRSNFAWYDVIDLQVRLADGGVVWIPWVSWGTQLEKIMTVDPPPLPRPSQQRVLDDLAAGLDCETPAELDSTSSTHRG